MKLISQSNQISKKVQQEYVSKVAAGADQQNEQRNQMAQDTPHGIHPTSQHQAPNPQQNQMIQQMGHPHVHQNKISHGQVQFTYTVNPVQHDSIQHHFLQVTSSLFPYLN